MNIHIRPLEVSDAQVSYRWRNDPELWVYTGFKPDKEIALTDEKAWIKKVVADETCRRFAIIADGTYVGNIYITDIRDGTGEYHVFIGDKKFWGKGVAKEASLQIIAYAKKELKLHTILLGVKKENIAACKLYLKLGFSDDGEKDGFTRMKLDLASFKE